MLSRTILSFVALAVAQQALAQPACLLAALDKSGHPTDQNKLCCSEANTFKGYLKDMCGDNTEAATKAYTKACQEAGYGTCAPDSSSSASSGMTSAAATSGSANATAAPYPVYLTSTFFDPSCTCTKTMVHSSTVSPGSSAYATGANPMATGSSGNSTSSGSSGSGSGSGSGSSSNSGSGSGANSGSGSGSGSGENAGSGASKSATGSPIKPATASSTSALSSGAEAKRIGSAMTGLLIIACIALAL